MRPIISNVGSVTYKLSKFLSKYLAKALGKISNSHIENNTDFIQKVKNISTFGKKLVSFDVNSLFTKVPIEETLTFLERKLPDLNLDLPVPVEKFLKLVRACVSDNVFSFKNNFYRQKFGMAMGSSLSPVLAGLFMEYFESELLPTILDHPLPWYRYVDDVFSLWPDNQNFQDFFQKLNSLHPTIKFKYEFEENKCLPFLDVMVRKSLNNNLEFSVFRKATHSNAYIHYFSCHDDSVKYSSISCMFLRAYRTCSPQFLDEEVNNIFEIFSKLSYPKWFIEQGHKKARKTYFQINSKSDDDQFKNCIVLPFNQNLKFLKSILKDTEFKLAFNNPGTLSKTLICNKNSTIEAGVYSIPCKEPNCKKSYFGETGRNIKIRSKEHKNDIRKGNDQNALFSHMNSTNHAIDFNNQKLLFKSENYVERRIVESCYIDSRNNFNLPDGHFKLSKI